MSLQAAVKRPAALPLTPMITCSVTFALTEGW